MKNLPIKKIEELKDFQEKYAKALTDKGLDPTKVADRIKNMAVRTTGNNGIAIGTTFTLTGDIELAVDIKDAEGKQVIGTFEGAKTTDGRYISITQLMGISSDKGYAKSGTLDNISREKNSDKAQAVNNPVTLEVIKDFDFKEVWQPFTRNKLQLLAALSENGDFFKNAKATYLGVIGKQVYAKKNSTFANDHYVIGDARAMTAKLWKIETPDGTNFNDVND